MNSSILHKENLKKYSARIDWGLLLFLVLVLNVKLVIKAAALFVFIILNWKQLRNSNPLKQANLYFYFGIIVIGLINLLLQLKQLQAASLFVAGLGTAYWSMAAAAAYIIVLFVKKSDPVKLNNSVMVFFCLHLLFIFAWLINIMIETGSINPYTFKGINQKYFINTGDFIRGITFDSPITTAFISSLGVLYFLYRDRPVLSILCMAGLLFQVSNLTNFIMAGILLFCLFFRSTKIQKSVIVLHLSMMFIFLARISPQNGKYMEDTVSKITGSNFKQPGKTKSQRNIKETPDSLLTKEEIKTKISLTAIDSMSYLVLLKRMADAPKTPVITLSNRKFESKEDSLLYEYTEVPQLRSKRNRFADFIAGNYSRQAEDSLQRKYNWKKPGKAIAYKQVLDFYKLHPSKILLGNGTGNFSSRLAFKATALDIAGSYPDKFYYVDPDFKNNHLYIFLYFFSQEEMKHSVLNAPDAVYSQLAGEYGIAGLILFVFLYIGYFLKRIKRLTYGIPMLLLLVSGFFIEYWFEQLSIVILFELLMLLDIEASQRYVKTAGDQL